jgi:hypothetical protein
MEKTNEYSFYSFYLSNLRQIFQNEYDIYMLNLIIQISIFVLFYNVDIKFCLVRGIKKNEMRQPQFLYGVIGCPNGHGQTRRVR